MCDLLPTSSELPVFPSRHVLFSQYWSQILKLARVLLGQKVRILESPLQSTGSRRSLSVSFKMYYNSLCITIHLQITICTFLIRICTKSTYEKNSILSTKCQQKVKLLK